MPIILNPISAPDAIDLITASFATQVLLAGGVTLTDAQADTLSPMITAASRGMIRFCNRRFGLATYIEIVTPEGGRQDRGEPASAKLTAFPIQSVTSVLTGRAGVLTIRNTSDANQYASVAFTTTADMEFGGGSYTGLSLSRTASGVASASSLAFANNATISDLSDAINALGNGWSATVQGSYGLYPSAGLVGVREPKDALSSGAVLDLFTTPATSYDIDRDTGILRCYGLAGSGFGLAFGDPFGAAWDGLGGYGGSWGWGQWRVEYQAGFATIPADLQLLCAEVVKGMFARLDADPSLKSESADKYSYTLRDVISTLPDWAQATLTKYKSWSV